jgi:hypothetical protein
MTQRMISGLVVLALLATTAYAAHGGGSHYPVVHYPKQLKVSYLPNKGKLLQPPNTKVQSLHFKHPEHNGVLYQYYLGVRQDRRHDVVKQPKVKTCDLARVYETGSVCQ